MDLTEWRALIKQLRTRFPTERRVEVRRCKAKRNCGKTNYNGAVFHIRVDSDQSDTGMIDTLLHEWAHAYAMDQAFQHRGNWALIFGEIYTAWTKDFGEENAVH